MRVTVPLVIAKLADGSSVYLYEGALVPEGLADGESQRLQDGEFVSNDESKPAARKSASNK